ncbi:hypothetical protein Leryth_010241 [Lithospermum erythrorhizon]|nr:hypothetical protein Leryth_010241 [Lithospermum erythrorhizon]
MFIKLYTEFGGAVPYHLCRPMYTITKQEVVLHFLQTITSILMPQYLLGICIITCLHGPLASSLTARTRSTILQGVNERRRANSL